MILIYIILGIVAVVLILVFDNLGIAQDSYGDSGDEYYDDSSDVYYEPSSTDYYSEEPTDASADAYSEAATDDYATDVPVTDEATAASGEPATDTAVSGDTAAASVESVDAASAESTEASSVESEGTGVRFHIVEGTTNVNVRAKPDAASQSLGTVDSTVKGEIIEDGDEWTLIKTDSGLYGYVMNQYIEEE